MPNARWCCATLAHVIASTSALADLAASFTGMGVDSWATGLSADGTTVIGATNANAHGYRWRAATGMQDLGLLAGYSRETDPNGVSADGEVVGGAAWNNAATSVARGFRWTPAGGMKNIGTMTGFTYHVYPRAMSGDGNTIVGTAGAMGGSESGFVWTPATNMTPFTVGRPRGMSQDGRFIVGQKGNQGFRWSQDAGTTIVPVPPEGGSITPWDISDNGRVMVGVAIAGNSKPWRWTEWGGFQYLSFDGDATSVSADGSVIVGRNGNEVTVWTSDGRVRTLRSILGDAIPAGWLLTSGGPYVSADGTRLAGTGFHDGHLEGWYAVIPSPSGVLLGALIAVRRARREQVRVGVG